MKYMIKDAQGNEHGPIDPETMAKWVDEDRVTAETPVRNYLLGSWKAARDIESLQDRLAEQAKRRASSETNLEKSAQKVKSIKERLFAKKDRHSAFKHKHVPEDASVLRRALAFLFDLAVIGVLVTIMLVGISIMAWGHAGSTTDSSRAELVKHDNVLPPPEVQQDDKKSAKAKKTVPAVKPQGARKTDDKTAAKESDETKNDENAEEEAAPVILKKPANDNLNATTPPYTKADEDGGYGLGSLWVDTTNNAAYVCLSGAPGQARWISSVYLKYWITWAVVILVPLILLYYGIGLGYFAQTFGMWFWGIFVCRKNELMEVYFFRAFCFSVFMLLLGIISPIFVYITGRSAHDMLVGVRVIRVCGASKI